MNQEQQQAGYKVAAWAKAVGISKTTFYFLDDESRPRQVRVGKCVIVAESPAAWLERVAAAGGAKMKERKVAA